MSRIMPKSKVGPWKVETGAPVLVSSSVRNCAALPLTGVNEPPTYTVWSLGPGITEKT